jgi:hypothetical protein
MPVTYRTDKTNRIIYTASIGSVTPEEVFDHFRALAQDPERPDRLNVLLDLSESASVPESEQLLEVVHQIEGISGKLQFDACAIVASRDVLFGMSRMFGVFAEKWFRTIYTCRTRDEAEAWLIAQSSFNNQQSAEAG